MNAKLLKRHPKLALFVVILIGFVVLNALITPGDENFFWRLPSVLAPLPGAINDFAEFLMFEWLPVDVWDPDLEEYEQSALLRELTRGFSGAVLFLIEFIRELLVGGVKTIVAFTSWSFVREHPWAIWPALPWTAVAGGAIIMGYALRGKGLALLAGLALTYISAFGQWEPAMQTLSFVLVAAPVSILLGLLLGIVSYKSRAVEAVLSPLLNIAQTMPHFSYLVPVTVFFGVGDHAGAIATIVFATPPMIRLTMLGLRKVPIEVVEAGLMNGGNNRQILWKVQVPTARYDILIGVNQVIMQCLAMAVIASFIGAKGLGFNLLLALNGLKIGLALELGICIVLIAVVLDKLSLAWAEKQTDYFADLDFVGRNKYMLIFAAVFAMSIVLAFLGGLIFKDGINYLYLIPHNKGITTEWFWQSGVDWMVENWYAGLQGFNRGLIINVLQPMKNAYLGMPVSATFLLVMGVGYLVGGVRSALIVGGFLLFIALTEWWDRALITAYLMSFAVIVSVMIGVIVGSVCAQHPLASKTMLLICDTLQTFPSFIYLIPVIMLFGVTDTSVLVAVIIYATIPSTRYTIEGIRNVPPSLRDAGLMSGATALQRWVKIDLPLAFPHIMLGVNQTVIFALFMVIIGAMIGTDDLGQFILKALSDKQGIGNGLMLGLCVAFIGLAVDHLINTWAKKRKVALGLN
ncbi:MAG: ABC transporter permease subunit [Rhodobacteraceae bacterium]|nr:ABC transporter permease subunit [Paracoccaceae bacterium]